MDAYGKHAFDIGGAAWSRNERDIAGLSWVNRGQQTRQVGKDLAGCNQRNMDEWKGRDKTLFDRRGILDQGAGVGLSPIYLAYADFGLGAALARDVEHQPRNRYAQRFFVEPLKERAIGPYRPAIGSVQNALAAQELKNERKGIGLRKKTMDLGADRLGTTLESAETRRDCSFGNHE